MRVAPQIITKPTRLLPTNRGGSSNKSISTDDPNTLTGVLKGRKAAHGISGNTRCLVTLAVDTAADITIWMWIEEIQKWVKLGANSTQSKKTFDALAVDGFNIPELTLFYLQGSVEVANAWTDANEIAERRIV